MGAWGEKPFQNDSALDWLDDFEQGGVAAIRDILGKVGNTDINCYIEIDDGAAVIAAAEIVAAAQNLDRTRVPESVKGWIKANSRSIVSGDKELAIRAIARVLNKNSELAALWKDVGPDSEWDAEIDALLRLLGTTRSDL